MKSLFLRFRREFGINASRPLGSKIDFSTSSFAQAIRVKAPTSFALVKYSRMNFSTATSTGPDAYPIFRANKVCLSKLRLSVARSAIK